MPEARRALNLVELDPAASPGEVAAELATPGLFGGAKVVLLQEPAFLSPKEESFPRFRMPDANLLLSPGGYDAFYHLPLKENATGGGLLQEVAYLERMESVDQGHRRQAGLDRLDGNVRRMPAGGSARPASEETIRDAPTSRCRSF